jgi:hypothetical protein
MACGTTKMGTTKMVMAAALAACAGITVSARAQEWKAVGEMGWFGVGKAHEVEKGHLYWVGEFSGTFFNDKGEGSLFHKSGVSARRTSIWT